MRSSAMADGRTAGTGTEDEQKLLYFFWFAVTVTADATATALGAAKLNATLRCDSPVSTPPPSPPPPASVHRAHGRSRRAAAAEAGVEDILNDNNKKKSYEYYSQQPQQQQLSNETSPEWSWSVSRLMRTNGLYMHPFCEMGATPRRRGRERGEGKGGRNDGAFQKTGTGHVSPLLCIK